MKKTFGISLLVTFLCFGIANVKADESLDDDGRKKCKTGERCPSGTYQYCDEFGKGSGCVCYYCN